MTIYPRRPNNVLNCTDVYVYDVEKTNEITCDDSGGACIWVGTFIAKIYNVEEPITYSWVTSTGIINSGQTDRECEVWITGTHPVSFELTATVTGANGSDTRAFSFTTTKMP